MNSKRLKKIFNRHKFILIGFVIFLISRILFFNTQEVFFDSGEYLHIFQNRDYFQSIIAGHFPPHVGNIALFWPVYHLFTFFNMDSTYFVILCQTIIAFVSLLFFYYVIKYLFDNKTAFVATIIASLTPLFWIMNVTLMMENSYIFYFSLSLFLLTRYLISVNKQYFLHISLFFFGAAVITQTMVILWAPVYLYVIFLKRKAQLLKITLLLILYVVGFSIYNIFFISTVGKLTLQYVVTFLYFKKRAEFPLLHIDLLSTLIVARNFTIPILRNNTSFVVLLSIIAFITAFFNNKKLFFLGLLWILPALYTNQWWDSLFNGRHGVLANFGIALMSAYIVKNNKLLFSIVICYLLLVSVSALTLLHKPIPYIVEEKVVSSIPKNALLIESHFARPQVQETSKAKTIYVNEPSWGRETIVERINKYLEKNQPVYISSAALSEPYGLYSGPYLHLMTLSYEHPYIMQGITNQFELKPYKIISVNDNLIIYKVIQSKRHPYPQVKSMKNSYRRIDYNDPFWKLTWWFESTFLHQT